MTTVYLTNFDPVDDGLVARQRRAQSQVIDGAGFAINGRAFPVGDLRYAYYYGYLPDFASTLALDLLWCQTGAPASASSVSWVSHVAAITPGDTTRISDKLFSSSGNFANSSALSDQRLQKTTISVTNTDSLAAGDLLIVRIYREPSLVTCGGTAVLLSVSINYSAPGGAGSGDVVGPSGATNLNIAVYDGITGKLIKDSGVPIGGFGTGNVSGPGSVVNNDIAVWNGTSGTSIKDGGIAISALGDVKGPASAASGDVVVYSGTTGKLVQDTGIPAANIVQGPASAVSGHVVTYHDATGKVIDDSGLALGNFVIQTTFTSVVGNLPSFSNTLASRIADSGVPAARIVQGPSSTFVDELPAFNNTTGTLLKRTQINTTVIATGVAPLVPGNLPKFGPASTGNPFPIQDSGISVDSSQNVTGINGITTSFTNGVATDRYARYNGTFLPPTDSVAKFTGNYPIEIDYVPVLIDGAGNITGVASINGGAYAPDLTVNKTWYINGTSGNDSTGDGSTTFPWKTITRAWTERNKYGVIKANLRIICQGAQTYTFGTLGRSVCGTGGTLSIEGDVTAITSLQTGSFSGPATLSGQTVVIPTTTVLTADTHRGRLCRITSGTLNGTEFLIGENATNSITMAHNGPLNGLSSNVVAGDTFLIFRPATNINNITINDWGGGGVNPGDLTVSPSHFIRCAHVAGGITVTNSALGFSAIDCNAGVVLASSQIKFGELGDGSRFGISGPAFIEASGLWIELGNLFADANTLALGVVTHTGSANIFQVGTNGPSILFVTGGRLLSAPTVNNGQMIIDVTCTYCKIGKTVSVETTGTFVQNGNLRLNPTVGNCFTVRGLAIFNPLGLSGGTTGAGGFGIKINGPARAILFGAPTLTGATAGQDLKTDNSAAVANATLAAAGNALLDAVNSGVIARI